MIFKLKLPATMKYEISFTSIKKVSQNTHIEIRGVKYIPL